MAYIQKAYDENQLIVDKINWGRSLAQAPKQLVIFCHGFRNNGRQMYAFANSWASDLPNAAFVAPNAPFRRISGLWGLAKFLPIKIKGDGFVWFQIDGTIFSPVAPGVDVATKLLNQFIDAELNSLSLPMDACALVGFSQGAVIALSAGLRRPVAPKAIIAISGATLNCDALAKEIANHSPALLIHSEDDKIIPVTAVRQVEQCLSALGVPVELVYRKSQVHHELDDFTATTCRNFLVKAFS